ncbi:MAG: Flp pilus assembly complex ATPase component TadA, partial [Candidatus Riflebacteria bacterium]|nr:Flp pilus assembly complex ATPase component TadA [Candidatus Riflebacteria bacterium]
MARIEKKLLGQSLIAEGLATPEQLKAVMQEQKKTSNTLGFTLIQQKILTEQQLLEFLVNKCGFSYANLRNYVIDPAIVKLIPEYIARKYQCIAILRVKGQITVAMLDPLDSFVIENLEIQTSCKIKPLVSPLSEIQTALDEFYSNHSQGNVIANQLKKADSLGSPSAATSIADFAKNIQGVGEKKFGDSVVDLNSINVGDKQSIVKLVNLIIARAIREKASDIHIEPDENCLRTRFRIDGMLQEVMSLPQNFEAATVSRCKVMAELDIAEKRIPQDGRIKLQLGNKEIDLRVSTYPTLRGEKVVMRILDKSSVVYGLEELGFSDDTLQNFSKLIIKPNGIILVTGPTGSGKTSTLYASLQCIKDPTINIVTIEDPVEYQLSGINQGQINPKAGFTFAGGLRSILRQDP